MPPRKLEVHVEILLEQYGFAFERVLNARHALEDFVIEQGLGDVLMAGTGAGVTEIYFGADRPEALIDALEPKLKELGIARITRCSVVPGPPTDA